MRKSIFLLILGLLLTATSLEATQITVTNISSPGWVQISNNTFGLPANLSGIQCGVENETTCEPQGVFAFNVAFEGSGVFNILDPEGKVSDQIHFFNGSNGLGVVTFKSDPDLKDLLPDASTLCTEESNGCVHAFTIETAGGEVVLKAASDNEAGFDPFGLHADSSDEFQVTEGAKIAPVPEPGSMVLLGTGLLSVIGAIRRRIHS